MFSLVKKRSDSRITWLIMALTAFALEIDALWFQYVMQLRPCVRCIYERCALFGIMVSGITVAIAPRTPLRYLAFAIW
ncbi:disulfide bond formation protein B, partial [Klebsiella pneumoniae]